MVSINPIRAINKFKEANENNDFARLIVDNANAKLITAKDEAHLNLRKLAKSKMTCYTETVPKLDRILKSCIDYEYAMCKFNGETIKFSPPVMSPALKNQCDMAESVFKSSATGLAGGSLMAYAVYGGVSTFASASTGTAISTLGGVAARNATLSWLGGGSISTGGGGALFGGAVLGGAAAAVGVVILGIQLNAQADKAFHESEKNYYDAQKIAEGLEIITSRTEKMTKMVRLARKVLKILNDTANSLFGDLEKAIAQYGKSFKAFPDEVQNRFGMAFQIFDFFNKIAPIELLNEKGELIEKSNNELDDLYGEVKKALN